VLAEFCVPILNIPNWISEWLGDLQSQPIKQQEPHFDLNFAQSPLLRALFQVKVDYGVYTGIISQ
jgi:hypothetical protein